ncbi:D-glucuronyl C5-epimerase family protein [Marinobacter sp. BGYM27]|uniref:D-glucuronyl C5-epimerase family protein n=1 Tax=Marinobacter sp. BGYM27 TaxID=2975597 RepID=UPI0021A41CB0|nr:D-glucuronyl C5-epimerase family protein [Marinobacter sp. BGYM27]MDG5499209.1 D-glucuronyl C5-epimerase family protein [Marinobacter sp. BGYM27]
MKNAMLIRRVIGSFFLVLAYSGQVEAVLPPDPFTPFASAREYASPPFGLGEDGVLYYDYGDRYGGLGKYRNPTFIATYANALYRDFIKDKKNSVKSLFLDQVDYLVQSAAEDEQGSFWPYPFQNTHYAAPEGWYSGMTSGRILGVLCRAHELTADPKYLKFADNVFSKLNRPIEKGGMISRDGDFSWIEEVAFPSVQSYKVLNGHIFGLSGLQTYARYSGNSDADKLVRQAIGAVKDALPSIDSGFLSYYSESVPPGRERFFAERGGYNTIHVSQMLWLYSQTNSIDFLKYAMRFQAYDIFEPIISSTFSTNAVTHGPERMNMSFGNSYWSSYEFPVEVEFDFGRDYVLDGFVILGHTQQSSPEDFYASIYDGHSWRGVAKGKGNSSQRLRVDFTHGVVASGFKLRVDSDNGNGAVALDGVGMIFKENFGPVINFGNYTSSARRIFDPSENGSILVKTNGFIVLPSRSAVAGISLSGDISNHSLVKIFGSDELDSWDEIDFKSESNLNISRYFFNSKNYKFYKVEFDKDFAHKISGAYFIKNK